ncbi:MAG: nucleotidyltransferase family protein [Bacteroidota bacterium]
MATIHPDEAGARPEYKALVLCCRTELTPAHADHLARYLSDEDLQWNYLVTLAGYHGVQPLLYCHLRSMEEHLLSEKHMTWLRGVVGARSAHSLVLMQELGRLTELCAQQHLPMLAVKGAVLAQSVYGGVALRPFADIDLVIRREDFTHLETLLRQQGYGSRKMSPFQKTSYLYINGQYTFWRRIPSLGEAAAFIDVHTAIMPPGYAYSENFDALTARSVTVPVAGRQVPTLGREDLLQVICYHGFKNRWDRFKYICDLAELIRASPDMDWEAAYHRMHAMRSRRVLRLGLFLASALLDAPLPRQVWEDVREDRRVRDIGHAIIDRLPRQAHIKVEPYWERVRLNVLAQDTVGGGLRYGAYSAARKVTDLYLPAGE